MFKAIGDFVAAFSPFNKEPLRRNVPDSQQTTKTDITEVDDTEAIYSQFNDTSGVNNLGTTMGTPITGKKSNDGIIESNDDGISESNLEGPLVIESVEAVYDAHDEAMGRQNNFLQTECSYDGLKDEDEDRESEESERPEEAVAVIADTTLEPIGPPIQTTKNGENFYCRLRSGPLIVEVGTFVKVFLQDEDDDHEVQGVCAVLAISERDELIAHVKWFSKPSELYSLSKKRHQMMQWLPGELVEIDLIQVIPAASIIALVTVSEGQASAASSYYRYFYDRSEYLCRYLYSEKLNCLFDVSPVDTFARGWKDPSLRGVTMKTHDVEDVSRGTDMYARAIRTLDLSSLPKDFPCREVECEAIENYVRRGIQQKGSLSPLYISGLPGTGKTASVASCIEKLRQCETLGSFQFITINCLKLKAPSDAYSLLWRSIAGRHLSHTAALKRLNAYFDGLRSAVIRPLDVKVTVCLVDEIDFLLNSNQNVLYNMLDWPGVNNSHLVVIGLANTMDLPEKFNKRIVSRMGTFQERMIFKPYSVSQIEHILQVRMGSLNVFESTSLKLLTRKAATVAGDLRAALRICQRAIQIHRSSICAEDLHSNILIPIPLLVVNKAAIEYKETPVMAMTKMSCQLYKSLFVSIVRHNRANGEAGYVPIEELYHRLQDTIVDLKNEPDFKLKQPSYAIYLECVNRMISEGYLLEDKWTTRGVGSKSKHQELGVSNKSVKLALDASDLLTALKGECFEKKL